MTMSPKGDSGKGGKGNKHQKHHPRREHHPDDEDEESEKEDDYESDDNSGMDRYPPVDHMPEDMSMSMEGKGKGGSKGSKRDSGKGKGKGSDSKGSKSGKKSKKDTRMPVAAPTKAPVAPTPTTFSPTSANSIPIRATPFALLYSGNFDRIPSDEEFAEVAELTRVYLEEFMIAEFDQTSLTNLDDFLTFMIRNSFEFGEPVQADYRSTGLFNPSSIFLPTVRELNELIDDAFMGENLSEYVTRIQNLPSGNIFSTVTAIEKSLPDVPVPRSPESSSTEGATTFKMGLAAAAAGIVVLAAGAALFKRQQADDEDMEDPYSDNLKGDSATIAGETVNTSLDGSSSWRKTSPYMTNVELDDEGFEDEPLDSDDEQDISRQRGSTSQAAFLS